MAHEVTVSVGAIPLKKARNALKLEISNDVGKIGELSLGKGTFRWKLPNEKKYSYLDWTDFMKFLTEHREEFYRED